MRKSSAQVKVDWACTEHVHNFGNYAVVLVGVLLLLFDDDFSVHQLVEVHFYRCVGLSDPLVY